MRWIALFEAKARARGSRDAAVRYNALKLVSIDDLLICLRRKQVLRICMFPKREYYFFEYVDIRNRKKYIIYLVSNKFQIGVKLRIIEPFVRQILHNKFKGPALCS
jgi:hypothetical protein